MDEERTLKTRVLPLPRSKTELLELFRQSVELLHVSKITVTPEAFEVSRFVKDGEEVLPAAISSADLDADFVQKQLTEIDSVDFDPDENPYILLVRAMQKISARRLTVVGFLAPHDRELYAAFLGLDVENAPTTLFGIPVFHYTENAGIEDKVVLVGSPTPNIRDAIYGVAVDMGA